MKQHITHEQFDQLNSKQKVKILERWSKKVGDLIFCQPELEGSIYFGVITDVKYGKAYSAWNLSTTSPTILLMSSDWYPLFSFGQLVEIIRELSLDSFDLNHKTIDDLWKYIVEFL